MEDVTDRVKRTYRSPARARGAVETQERIRRAALELFVSRGYIGTTLKDVAAKAKVGERTVYDNFGGKFGLFRHTMAMLTMGDEDRTPAADRSDAVATRDLADPREAIAAHCLVGAELMERAGDLIMVGEAVAGADPKMRRFMDRGTAATYEVHRRLVERLRDRGELRVGVGEVEGADILVTIGSPAVFHSLRRRCGWSRAGYLDWLTTTAISQLLGD